MVAHTMPQQRKKEESERLRGERDQIKFIDLISIFVFDARRKHLILCLVLEQDYSPKCV